MSTTRVTLDVPTDLLDLARKNTGEGITATIRRGLGLVVSTCAQERLRGLRGRLKVSIDLAALRQDRPWRRPAPSR